MDAILKGIGDMTENYPHVYIEEVGKYEGQGDCLKGWL
jgi:hypothetical protein